MTKIALSSLALCVLLFGSCKKDPPAAPAEEKPGVTVKAGAGTEANAGDVKVKTGAAGTEVNAGGVKVKTGAEGTAVNAGGTKVKEGAQAKEAKAKDDVQVKTGPDGVKVKVGGKDVANVKGTEGDPVF